MKERPILMSAPMVLAILSGHKTMTRRVVKPPKGCDAAHAGVDFGGPYAVGMRLWVRETWAKIGDPPGDMHYRAHATPGDEAWFKEEGWKWRPSIFMPRWASRITLEVAAVRVERLREITYLDIVAEGVPGHGGDVSRALTEFMVLWNKINAKRGYSWQSNPWVWVVEFKKL